MMKKVLFILFLLIPFVNAESISSYPDQLDYRDFQGESWLTNIKSQSGCGSCWAFAAVGVLEGFINLYFNQQIDVDLSEQHLVSDCCVDCGSCSGGIHPEALDFAEELGIVEESCFPYLAENSPCDLCDGWEYKLWKINNENIFDSEEALELYPPRTKSLLFEHGPISVGLSGWNHAVGLVGYNQYQDTWIIRNSWGENWGEDGYGHITFSYEGVDHESSIYRAISINPHSYLYAVVEEPVGESIKCSDWDGDGYCYWGLTEEKPSNCPSSCEVVNYKDEDDSNQNVDRVYDLWISYYDIPKILKFDSVYDLEANVSFKGNLQNDFVENVVFYAYYDNQLIYEQIIESMVDGDEISLGFTLDPMIVQDNPYMYHNLNFIVEPKEGEIWQDNNYLERKIWIYTHDEGYQIWEDNYVFDCLTSENPEGQPIDAMVGRKSFDVGISANKDNFNLRNCVLAGWETGLDTKSREFIIEDNSFMWNSFCDLNVWEAGGGLVNRNYFYGSHTSVCFWNNDYGSRIEQNIFKNFSAQAVHLSESDDNTVVGNNFSSSTFSENFAAGVRLYESSGTIISGNYFDGINHGIKLLYSFENEMTDNHFRNIHTAGIFLDESSFNSILNNYIVPPTWSMGIYISDGSSENLITENYVCGNVSSLDHSSFACEGILNYGVSNIFGYWDEEIMYGVDDCLDGWPEYGMDFFACNDDYFYICSQDCSIGGCEGMPCGENEICEAGVCVLDCPAGWFECSGECVDVMTDENHCGGCDIPCSSGKQCINGQCRKVYGGGGPKMEMQNPPPGGGEDIPLSPTEELTWWQRILNFFS